MYVFSAVKELEDAVNFEMQSLFNDLPSSSAGQPLRPRGGTAQLFNMARSAQFNRCKLC